MTRHIKIKINAEDAEHIVTGTKKKNRKKFSRPQLQVLKSGVVLVARFTNSWYVAD
jgi:hypothetical protein